MKFKNIIFLWRRNVKNAFRLDRNYTWNCVTHTLSFISVHSSYFETTNSFTSHLLHYLPKRRKNVLVVSVAFIILHHGSANGWKLREWHIICSTLRQGDSIYSWSKLILNFFFCWQSSSSRPICHTMDNCRTKMLTLKRGSLRGHQLGINNKGDEQCRISDVSNK